MANLTRKQMPSPNKSSRGGATVRLIVLHTAEGATTIESLGNFFASSSSQVSSHVGIDDKAGVIGEYVKRSDKAWTAADYNPVAVQAELCGFAKWSTSEWNNKHANMLENAARWIAEEAAKYGIPITKLSAGAAQGSGRGVCQHRDLGAGGGGHTDCGNGFPMDKVLDMAKGKGGSDDYMNPPKWLWDWLDWYMTTDRDPKKKPDAAPDKIPDWAWDYQKETDHIAQRFGMTEEERDWLVWHENGKKGDRPDNVRDTIPDRWWDDEKRIARDFNPA